MPKGYNSLNDIKTNPYEIGICPICSVRLTHGCEHSQNQLAQEWLAAVIVAEQDGYSAGNEPAPLKRTIHMTDYMRGVYTARQIALDENGNLRPYSSFPRTSGAIADDHEIHSYTVDGE